MMQLRNPTVLFIDDNHGNRQEALMINPGIQIADASFIDTMLLDPRCAGNDDHSKRRLAQYKLLEQKTVDKKKFTSSNLEFLKLSDIKVTITYDIEHDLDRAIELINRTNQLNFTKERLPDEISAARAEIKQQLAGFDVRAGFVHAKDRYGDYGCVGFFLLHGHWGLQRLRHFVFSCRTLGMGIEQWVYNKLGRPDLSIAGDVVSNIALPMPDWINAANVDEVERDVDRCHPLTILLRGGCENEILEHYFRFHNNDVKTEFLYMKKWLLVPRHNTTLLAQALVEPSVEILNVLGHIGFEPCDISSNLFSRQIDGGLIVYFPSGDGMPIIRHKTLDLSLPLVFHGHGVPGHRPEEEKHAYFKKCHFSDEEISAFEAIEAFVRREFTLEPDPLVCAQRGYRRVAENLRPNALFIIIKPNYERLGSDGQLIQSSWGMQLNAFIEEAFAGRTNVRIIDMRSLIEDLILVVDDQFNHFHRLVYYKLYNVICRIYSEWVTAARLEPIEKHVESRESVAIL